MTRNAFRLTTAAALCVFVLSCAAVSLHAQDAAETAARALAGELGARQFDKVAARFNETTAKAISVERLASTWDQIVAQAGEFKSVASAKSGDMQGQHLVVLTCTFDTTTLYITVGFDSAAKVSGLIITPQPPPL